MNNTLFHFNKNGCLIMEHFGETDASRAAQMYHGREKANFVPWPGYNSRASYGQSFRGSGYGYNGGWQSGEDVLRQQDSPSAAQPYSGEYTNRALLGERLKKAQNDEQAVRVLKEYLPKLEQDIKDKKGEIPEDKYMDLCQQHADVKMELDQLSSNRDIHYNGLVHRDDDFRNNIKTLKGKVEELEKNVEELENENAELKERLEAQQQQDRGSKAQKVSKSKSKKKIWGWS